MKPSQKVPLTDEQAEAILQSIYREPDPLLTMFRTLRERPELLGRGLIQLFGKQVDGVQQANCDICGKNMPPHTEHCGMCEFPLLLVQCPDCGVWFCEKDHIYLHLCVTGMERES